MRIIRLNADGSVENSFVVRTGFNFEVQAPSPGPSGSVSAAGLLTRYGSTVMDGVAHLESDGGLR